eukprot:107440-Prorocentrum_minimum.AAC.2
MRLRVDVSGEVWARHTDALLKVYDGAAAVAAGTGGDGDEGTSDEAEDRHNQMAAVRQRALAQLELAAVGAAHTPGT